MEKILCFGHMNPDTDSVCASITLANLKRKLGLNVEERVLGPINKESQYVLNYFNVEAPKYLNDVKLQIKDLNYRKNCYMNQHASVKAVYDFMQRENTTGVPIVNDSKKLVNLITAKQILNKLININYSDIETSYDNIIDTLNGTEVIRFDNEIKGKVTAVTFAHSTFENSVNLGQDDIIIVGDRHYIIDLAIKSKVKLIIIIGNSDIKEEHLDMARKNKVNIIKTGLNTFETVRLIMYSNYIKKILNEKDPYVLNINDYYYDFEKNSNMLSIDNFPLVDKNGKCMGLLRKSELDKLSKKKAILVDHNESEQSAIGIEEADIIEIIDHHKIGRISTNAPINFRNMTVGCTNTIIYFLYKENGITISREMAGLMMSAIISDTLLFKSPTTTAIDKKVVEELNEICKLDVTKYAMDMFKAGTSLEGLSISEIVNGDSKTFNSNDISFTISQAFTMDYETILNNIDDYMKEIEISKIENKSNHFIFVVTDIIKNGSYIFYDKNSEELVKRAWNKEDMKLGTFIDNCVSRKQQIVPAIMGATEK